MTSFPSHKLKDFLSALELRWAAGIFCLFFLALLSSQSGMDFFAGVMFLTSIYWIIRHFKDHWNWPRLNLWWLWLIWVPVIAIGLYLNPIRNDRLDLFFEFRWIIDLYVFILFFSLFYAEQKIRKTFVIMLTIASAIALIIYFLGYNPLNQSWADRAENLKIDAHWRAGGLYDHSMPLAHTYGPILLVFTGFLMQNWAQRKKLSKWLFAAVGLTALTVLLTFTRGVWIGVACGLLAMGFILHRRLGLILTMAILVSGLLVFAGSEKVRNRVMITINMTNQGDHERLTLWRTNWEIFKDNPLVGTGYAQNKTRLREYYDRMGIPEGYFEGHAHNQYIHFLAGTGLLGLLCYLIFIGWALIKSFKAYELSLAPELKGITLGCIGAQICFHVGSLTESNFSIGKNRFMILFIIAWAIAIYLKQRNEASSGKLK